ncbi:hypothetical protein [Maritimibacter sp.]|uniref:hypothetical protein n=1 Tax=Maritimibacter sp. TaxID=2003363 RepID=UPI00257F2D6D|nr:hypothetical protein [Maritimibacter sp.]
MVEGRDDRDMLFGDDGDDDLDGGDGNDRLEGGLARMTSTAGSGARIWRSTRSPPPA